jgi:hypothetical protein
MEMFGFLNKLVRIAELVLRPTSSARIKGQGAIKMDVGAFDAAVLRNAVRIAVCSLFVVTFLPVLSYAQVGRTITQTQTSHQQTNNQVFGCEACRSITSQTDPHPDTSSPMFAGDPRTALLPSAIAQGLPPDNQFGNGVPDGNSGHPINQATGLNLPGSDASVSFSSALVGTPEPGGGRSNVLTQSIQQVIPGADSETAGLADQQFSMHFQVTSLTDPDGHLVGAATGTAVQTLNGVETSTSFSFDAANGLVPAQPFPYVNPSQPTAPP